MALRSSSPPGSAPEGESGRGLGLREAARARAASRAREAGVALESSVMADHSMCAGTAAEACALGLAALALCIRARTCDRRAEAVDSSQRVAAISSTTPASASHFTTMWWPSGRECKRRPRDSYRERGSGDVPVKSEAVAVCARWWV